MAPQPLNDRFFIDAGPIARALASRPWDLRDDSRVRVVDDLPENDGRTTTAKAHDTPGLKLFDRANPPARPRPAIRRGLTRRAGQTDNGHFRRL